MVELLIYCFASFVLGFVFGGFLLFLGTWLGSRYSEGGRFFIPQQESEFIPHEISEDYFERALQSPDQGGLEFPADFSDEALEELYNQTGEEKPRDFDANAARADQLRGYF